MLQPGVVLILGMARRGECESLHKRASRLGFWPILTTSNGSRMSSNFADD